MRHEFDLAILGALAFGALVLSFLFCGFWAVADKLGEIIVLLEALK